MAKRKQSSNAPLASRKRARGPQSNQAPPTPAHRHSNAHDSQREYTLRAILAEDQYRYLIDWADDETTGEKYAPTWEPKRNANREAVADWKLRRRAEKATPAAKAPLTLKPHRPRSTSAVAPSSLASQQSPAAEFHPRRSRLRRIILSSSQPEYIDSPEATKAHQVDQGASTDDGEDDRHEVAESQYETLNDTEAQSSPASSPSANGLSVSQLTGPSGKILVSEPPSSFLAGDHEEFAGSYDTQALEPGSESQTTNPSQTQADQAEPSTSTESATQVSNEASTSNDTAQSQDPQVEATPYRIVSDSQSLREPPISTTFITISDDTPSIRQGISSSVTQPTSGSQRRDFQSLRISYLVNNGEPTSAQPAITSSRPETKGSSSTQQAIESQKKSAVTGAQSAVFSSQPAFESTAPQQALAPNFPVDLPIDLFSPFAVVGNESRKKDVDGLKFSKILGSLQEKDPERSLQNLSRTPPRRGVRDSQTTAGKTAANRVGSYSQSSFPFETQLPQSPRLDNLFPAHTASVEQQGHAQSPTTINNHSNTLPRLNQQQYPQSRLSSSVPSVPTGPLTKVPPGESAPPQPRTPSPPSTSHLNSTMDPSHSNLTPDYKARALEPHTAVPPRLISEEIPALSGSTSFPAPPSEAGARSPSAVPAEEPLPVITQEEQNTNEAFRTLIPQARHEEPDERSRNSVTAIPTTPRTRSTNEDPETANVHTVPISMVGHQKDVYPLTAYAYAHKDEIRRFLKANPPTDDQLADAQKFIAVMRNIVLHPDLNMDDSATQYDVAASHASGWSVNASAKFRFLKVMLDALRERNVHVVVAAQAGKIMDILETFMTGQKLTFRRCGSNYEATDSAGLAKVTLFSPGDDVAGLDPVDVVVSLDVAITHDSPRIKAVRFKDGKWAPFITVVIPRSVEHIDLCLSSTLSVQAKAKTLVKGIVDMKEEAGHRSDGVLHPNTAAQSIAQYLITGDAHASWPIADLEPLEDLDSQTDSEIDPLPAATVEVEGASVAGEKRLRQPGEVDMPDTTSNKRARVKSPEITAASTELAEITHVSDSVDNTSQEIALPSIPYQTLLLTAQSKIDDLARAVGEVQYRYEEQRNELVKVGRERDQAIETAQQAVARYSEQSNRLSTLRAERTVLKQHLAEANVKLTTHANLTTADFESLRLKLEAVELDNAALKTKLASANNQLDYVRGMYQSSSSAAHTSASQVDVLEAELAIANTKASGELTRAKQLSLDNFARSLRFDNHRLKAQLKERDGALRARDEEIARLKEANRGRMGTRGSSLPRSPRIASPMKLAATSAGPRSRQASPAAGELRGRAPGGSMHPLRH